MSQTKPQSARAVAEAMLKAFESGDWPTITSFIDEDCVIREAPSMPYPGEFRGHEGFRRLIEAVMGTWRDFSTIPTDIIGGEGERVAILSRLTGKGGPRNESFDMPFIEVFRVQNGKVVEIQPFYWDTKRLAEIHAGA